MTASDIFLLVLPYLLAALVVLFIILWFKAKEQVWSLENKLDWNKWDAHFWKNRYTDSKALANKFRDRLKKYGHLEDGE